MKLSESQGKVVVNYTNITKNLNVLNYRGLPGHIAAFAVSSPSLSSLSLRSVRYTSSLSTKPCIYIGKPQNSPRSLHVYPSSIERDRERAIWESRGNGDSIRGGGEGDDGAGGVQRRVGEHWRRGAEDTGEAAVGGRFEALFLPGPVHIPHTQIRRPHLPLYGQRHLWKSVILSVSLTPYVSVCVCLSVCMYLCADMFFTLCKFVFYVPILWSYDLGLQTSQALCE